MPDDLATLQTQRSKLLETVKLGDFLLRLAQRGGIGKGFCRRLAGHAASEAKLRVMSGLVAEAQP